MVLGLFFGFVMRRVKGFLGEFEKEIFEEEGLSFEIFRRLLKFMVEFGGRREFLLRFMGMVYGYI